ncbi:BatD family protein [Cerasicoccus maritimus]|uniref:BatD family protein n=1 Tax=Cerasicoccus maritimus TaxID=490089 RepID=UPI002852A861|nr:BatD family protein [Cerasicoccus maritimus]
MNHQKLFTTLFLLCAFAASLFAQQGDLEISSGFEPNVIRVNQYANYQFSVSNSRGSVKLEEAQKPEVPGLPMQYLGPNTQTIMNSTNGHVRHMYINAYAFRAAPEKPGEYTVPAFKIRVNGQDLEVPAAKLTVLDAQEPDANGNGPAVVTEIEWPREKFYVGEAIKAKVKLIVDPEQVQRMRVLRDVPFIVKEGDAFTISNFSQSDSKRIVRDNQVLEEHSWEVVITPLKTGQQSITLQSDWAVTTKSDRNQRRGRSLMDSFFINPYDTQQVTLYSEHDTIDVQPLPNEGQPTYYTGGIGMFTVDKPRLSESTGKAGEPLTMILTVRGQGNFERLQAPTLAESDAWRDYAPEEEFFAADQIGYTGAKTFEYTLIPRDSGELTTPEIAFNFFDPETAKYVELPIPGQAITIAENPNAQRPKRNPVAARRGPELLPIATTAGAFVSAISPIVKNPVFIAGQIVPALAIGLLFLSRRQKLRLEQDAEYARNVRANQATKAELATASNAAQQQDATAFYAAAQRAVQAAAGRHVEQAPESLTIADLESVATKLKADETTLKNIRAFMEAGDAIRFGGLANADIDFSAELARLETTVNNLGGKQ